MKTKILQAIFVLFLALSAFFIGIQLAFLDSRFDSYSLSYVYTRLQLLIRECDKQLERSFFFRCFEMELKPLVRQYAMSNIMKSLEEIFEGGSQKSPRGLACHDVGHIVGELGFKDNGNLGKTIANCGRTCGYGCTHGAALAALRQNTHLLDDIDSICEQVSSSSFPGQDLTACHHGLGHGFAEIAQLDIVRAVKLCDLLNSQSARIECATGVFMEIIDAPTLSHAPLELPEDIPGFCRTLTDLYAEVCLINAGAYEFHRSHDVQKALHTCEALPRDLYRRCNVGLGSDFYFRFTGNIGDIWNACISGKEDQGEPCIEGALISGFVNDPSGQSGIKLCRVADDNFRPACFAYLGKSIERLHGKEGSKKFCNALYPEEKISCLDFE